MTPRRAERLCDAEITRVEPRTFAITLVDDGYKPETYEFTARTERIALQNLVDEVYKIRSQRCFEMANWKCSYCGSARGMKPLQVHHDPYRSHGGVNKLEHMKSCCSDCHHQIHSGKKVID